MADIFTFGTVKFMLGLFIGAVLTFKYVVVTIYHPIIRDQQRQIDALTDKEKQDEPE